MRLLFLLAVLVFLLMAHDAARAATVTGQNDWCFISPSGVLFCDYKSYDVCTDANGVGACTYNPKRNATHTHER
jgi:hypothetical protein